MPEGKFYRVVFDYVPQRIMLFAKSDQQAERQSRDIIETIGLEASVVGSYEILVEGEDR